MELSRAVETIEYKIATSGNTWDQGGVLKMDVNTAWPSIIELTDAISKKYPYISLRYDFQPNDIVQLEIINTTNRL